MKDIKQLTHDASQMICKLDAVLYIDVTCWACKRSVALSNTREIEGRRYCDRCAELCSNGKGKDF